MEKTVIRFEAGSGIEYGFSGLDNWEDFEPLAAIIQQDSSIKRIDAVEGPYSKFNTYEKDGYQFMLMYHPELGNSLSLSAPQEGGDDFLKLLAETVLSRILLQNSK